MTDPRDLPSDLNALRSIRADALQRLGRTGAGIGIAVLDTGVTEVPALAGRVTDGVNLSGVGGIDDPPVDWFGHGTFVAGLAAGDPDAMPFAEFPGGVAPGAHIVPIKVASPDGATDVTNVIAGIQWAVANADRLNIRVLNLSFGTNSTLPFQNDPLNHVVERAWDAGIVVVVSAGNVSGPDSATTPGRDPLVLTVGSARGGGTPTVADDRVEEVSGEAVVAGVERPDVVAPGERLVSLAVDGSFISVQSPQARRADGYARATGTSFASALVSGAVALLLQAHPEWTPDQVKGALMATAQPINGPASRQGAGIVDVAAADGLVAPPAANVRARRGLLALHGVLGEVEKSRGTLRVQRFEPDSPTSTVVLDATSRATSLPDVEFTRKSLRTDGWTAQDWDRTWRRVPWHPVRWAAPEADDAPDEPVPGDDDWAGFNWAGFNWAGFNWAGFNWAGFNWAGFNWAGFNWAGNAWAGHQWWGHHWG